MAKAKLRLTLSIWDYDRTRALADGSVRPEGIELNVLELPVEETFFRMARYREFDLAEMSMSSSTKGGSSSARAARPTTTAGIGASRRSSCPGTR